MSTGSPHPKQNERHYAELKKLMAEPSFRQMWGRTFTVDTTHDIGDSAGYNVLGTKYYLDTNLNAAIRSGKIVVPNMTPEQIIQALLLHERTEKCLLDASNDIDDYQSAHEYATAGEHRFVRSVGATPQNYERALAPMIKYNEKKRVADPPLDLQCSPYRENEDPDDKRILKEMVAKGVVDATKISKTDANYKRATDNKMCGVCSMWQGPRNVELSPCSLIGGAVRNSFVCNRYEAMKNDQAGSRNPSTSVPTVPQGVPNVQGVASQGQGGGVLQQAVPNVRKET